MTRARAVRSRTFARRLIALCGLVGALCAAGLLLAVPASAHASVVSSDPVNGSRLKAVPNHVTITFDESVGLGSIGYLRVVDQSGRRVDTGAAYHVGGSVIAVALKSRLGDGTYTESFRIVSADSHPVAGTVRFVVGNGVLSAAPAAGSTVNHATSVLLDLVRWVSYAGFALLGGAWVLLTVWPAGRGEPRARRAVWTGWALALVGAAGELLLQGPYTAGLGLSHVFDGSLLDGTLHTDYGQYHSVRLVLLGAIAVLLSILLQRGRSRIDDLVLLLGVGISITFAAVGHAATTNPDWLSISADVLHITSMAAWIGGIAMVFLAVLPRADADDRDRVLGTVSRTAFTAVIVMALTGSYAAWRGVGTVHAIFSTTYGALVVVKVSLFIGLVLLGNLARRALRSRAGTRHEKLRRGIAVELVIALGVLAATGVLVAEPRGKEALAVAHAKARSGSAAVSASREVTVTVDPGVHGTVTVSVALSQGTKPLSVTGTASLPSKSIGPIPLGLTAEGTNLYGASGVVLPAAGRWVFALVVTTSEFNAVTTAVTIHLY